MKVWDDGQVRDLEDVRVSPLDRGFLIGDGVFETIRVAGGRARRLPAHLARLAGALEAFAIPYAVDGPAIEAGIAALTQDLPEAAVRLTVSRGEGPRGLDRPADAVPRALMIAAPAPPAQGPLKLVVETEIRRCAASPSARHKTLGGYVDLMAARAKARAGGADEAVMLDHEGRLAGATAANLFWIDADGRAHTPPLDGPVLPGVTRAAVIAAARGMGVAIGETRAGPEALETARAAFLTNALGGVMAIASVGQARLDPDHQLLAALGAGDTAVR